MVVPADEFHALLEKFDLTSAFNEFCSDQLWQGLGSGIPFRMLELFKGLRPCRRPLGHDFHRFWPKFEGFGPREWFQMVRTAISCQFPVQIPRDLSPGSENGLVSFSWKYGNQLGGPYLHE